MWCAHDIMNELQVIVKLSFWCKFFQYIHLYLNKLRTFCYVCRSYAQGDPVVDDCTIPQKPMLARQGVRHDLPQGKKKKLHLSNKTIYIYI